MEFRLPDNFQEKCVKCTYYISTGIVDDSEGYCSFYKKNTFEANKCFALNLLESNCPNCGKKLDLDKLENDYKKYVCKSCNVSYDLKEYSTIIKNFHNSAIYNEDLSGVEIKQYDRVDFKELVESDSNRDTDNDYYNSKKSADQILSSKESKGLNFLTIFIRTIVFIVGIFIIVLLYISSRQIFPPSGLTGVIRGLIIFGLFFLLIKQIKKIEIKKKRSIISIKLLISRFMVLPKGLFRLFITLSFIIPLALAIMLELNAKRSDGEIFVVAIIIGTFLYWILLRVGLWIYDGFKDDLK